jgi:predicted alpha/beta hydrolase
VRSLSLPHDNYAPRAATEHLLQLAGVGPEAVERFEGPGPLGHFDWLKEPRGVARRMQAILAGWTPRRHWREEAVTTSRPGQGAAEAGTGSR